MPHQRMPDPPTSMRRWHTDSVPDSQRLAYWVDVITDGFLAMEADSPLRKGFAGELCSARLGGVGLNWVAGSVQDVYRTGRGIARSSVNYHYLLGDLVHPWTAGQDGRQVSLLPGDFLLIDSRRPYEFHFPAGPATVSVELPLDWLAGWVAQPEAQGGRHFSAAAGWAGVLARYAAQLRPEFAANCPVPAELITDQLGSLLALACNPPGDAGRSDSHASLRRRVQAQLLERLHEPGLTALAVAQSLGVSVRSLHRAMAAGNQTFADHLCAARMAAARRMLQSRQFDRLTTAEIGRRVGLSEPSHFVRQFRRAYGSTPAHWRRLR